MGLSGILRTLYLLVVTAAIGCDGAAGQPQNDTETARLETRSEYFVVGNDVKLSCNNVTWTTALYFIWKINITGIQCLISEGPSKPKHNNCTGGKVLRNTTRGESYLYIPSFALRDEGTYTCDTAFRGGGYKANIKVLTVVPPVLSTKLVNDGGQRFAVCSAAGGKPNSTVSWEKMWDSPKTNDRLTTNAEGTITLESWLSLPENASSGNVTCVVSHPAWAHKRNITMELSAGDESKMNAVSNSNVIMAATSVAVLLIVALVALLSYVAHKHCSKLGVLVGHCCQSDAPSSNELKENQEVEEVEPYESYVQRVNSIYNSSADLFGV